MTTCGLACGSGSPPSLGASDSSTSWTTSWRFTCSRVPRSGNAEDCRRRQRGGGHGSSSATSNASRKRRGTSGSVRGSSGSDRTSGTDSACCAPTPASRPSASRRWPSAWLSASTCSCGSMRGSCDPSREPAIQVRWLPSTHGCRTGPSSASGRRTTSSRRRRPTSGRRRSPSPSTASRAAANASSVISSRRTTSRRWALPRPPAASSPRGRNGSARSRWSSSASGSGDAGSTPIRTPWGGPCG